MADDAEIQPKESEHSSPSPAKQHEVTAPMLPAEGQIPPIVIKEYESWKNENKRREWWKIGIEAATLVAVVTYAFIAAIQAMQMRKATEASQKSATSATRAIDLAERQFRLDQRAWLTIQKITLLREPGATDNLTVLVSLINTGKTPATFTTKDYTVISTGNDEPPLPKWEDIANAGNPRIIVPGDISVSIEAGRGMFDPMVFRSDVFRTGRNPDIARYRAGGGRLYVYFRIDYTDFFGTNHYTEVCGYRSFGEPPDTFHSCSQGNGFDRPQD